MNNPVEVLGEDAVTRILQVKELAMLKEVKRILELKEIPFYLACGTALGCARHKGFIPWDDDIDIYIKGEDYERVKQAIANDSNRLLRFQDHSTEKNYPYWFPKIVASDTVLVEKAFGDLSFKCGVYIDVFPLYYAPDKRMARLLEESLRYFRYAYLRAHYNNNYSKGLKRAFKHITNIYRPEKVQRKLEDTYKKNRDKSLYYVDSGVFHQNAILRADSFSSTVLMKFEDSMMPMPVGYDKYLKDYYGDYMKLPPEDQRISRHHIAELCIPDEPMLKE